MFNRTNKPHHIRDWLPSFLGFFLIGLGALLNLRPFSLMFQNFYESLDQGATATLVTAFIGFGAIWLQTKIGYKNIINSHDYQYQLTQKIRTDDDLKTTKNTVAALNSELLYAYNQLDHNILYITNLLNEVKREVPEVGSPLKIQVAPVKPEIMPYTYQACLLNISSFSSDAIFKITNVYNYLLKEEPLIQLNTHTQPIVVSKLNYNLEKLNEIKIDIVWLKEYFLTLN